MQKYLPIVSLCFVHPSLVMKTIQHLAKTCMDKLIILRFFFFFTFRLQRNELSAEKSQLVQNGPVLHSTPFSHQSSLQQELEAQEVPTFKLLMSNSQLLLL